LPIAYLILKLAALPMDNPGSQHLKPRHPSRKLEDYHNTPAKKTQTGNTGTGNTALFIF